MTVLITISSPGIDLDLFDLYSDSDGFTTPFETNVTKAALVAGYSSSLVPDDATQVKIKSKNKCSTEVTINLTELTTSTTSTTSSSSTTTTTSSTTISPNCRRIDYSVHVEDLTNPSSDDGKVYIRYKTCIGIVLTWSHQLPVSSTSVCGDNTYTPVIFILIGGVETPVADQPTVTAIVCS